MPSSAEIGNWLALVVLAALLIRQNQRSHERLRQLCFAIIRHEKGAQTLQLAVTLPGAVIQTLVLWLLASLLNERAAIRSWRTAVQSRTSGISPFLQLSEGTPEWKLLLLLATQGALGLVILAALTADAQQLFEALLALDGPQLIHQTRDLLATPGFWLWAYLAFIISQRMLPASTNLRQALPWLLAIGTAILLAGIAELGTAQLAAALSQWRSWIARGLLAALSLQIGFLVLFALADRLRRLFRRVPAPQTNHPPEPEHDQARHQR